MAQTDRFMIAPINTGMQTDLTPWLIPDDAFSSLVNAYVFRGRVRKRFGSLLMNQAVDDSVAQLYSRLRINIGNTDPITGNFVDIVPGSVDPLFFGQMFSVGDDRFTVNQLGTSGDMLTTSATATGTFNTTTGDVTITAATPDTPVYFYPGLPVMGLISYEDAEINSEPLFAFDTKFAYTYTAGPLGAWTRSSAEGAESPGAALWTGTDAQFFWGSTYIGILRSSYFLFVTNFNAPDRIRYWSGTDWNYLSPVLNSNYRLWTARIIIPFKNRLVCLNTIENNEGVLVTTSTASTGDWSYIIPAYSYIPGRHFVVGTTVYTLTSTAPFVTVSAVTTNAPAPTAVFVPGTGTITVTGNGNNANLPVYYFNNTTSNPASFVNRCRYSQNGSPVAENAWLDNVAGLGGFTDAPTREAIVTAGFLKDRLIVYFETSTWELAYTGNQLEPFVWQQINTELGAESTFSVVPFDKQLLGVGNVGIHSCNGSNVDRIDENIPDLVFEVSNDNEGVFRVYGIRDYFVEMVYWAFPSEIGLSKFPDRVLVYNYKTGSWAFNYDSITAFGYYQKQPNLTWESVSSTWEEMEAQWDDGTLQTKFRDIVAGNQEGFVFIVNTDVGRNAPSLQITDMVLSANTLTLTVIDHNLSATSSIQEADGSYIIIESALVNTATPPTVVVAPLTINGRIFPTYQVIDKDTITIAVDPADINGIYIGGGTLARVSNIDITTKQYNFYVQEGRNASINKVDFLVDKTSSGQVTVDYSVSSSSESTLQSAASTGALVGNGVLETSPYALIPLEQTQARLWHPIYPMANGECIQLNIYMKDAFDLASSQIRNPSIAFSDFQLGAMTFYTQRTNSRLQ